MSDEQWRDTSEFLPNWSPIIGPKIEGQEREKFEAGDDSYIEGWYLGKRDAVINGDPMVIHKIRATKCGNPKHLSKGELNEQGVDVEFFGATVINDKLASECQPGQYVRVKWMGFTEAGGNIKRGYHNWKLFIGEHIAPITVNQGVVTENAESSSHEVASAGNESQGAASNIPQPGAAAPAAESPAAEGATIAAGEGAVVEDDDDLPF